MSNYKRRRKKYGNAPEIIGTIIGIILVIGVNLLMLAVSVWVIIKVLQWTGVIG